MNIIEDGDLHPYIDGYALRKFKYKMKTCKTMQKKLQDYG